MSLRRRLKLDDQYCMIGSETALDPSEATRLLQGHSQLALELSRGKNEPEINRLLAEVSVGNSANARLRIENLRSSVVTDSESDLLEIESLIQESRLAGIEADWNSVIDLCSRLLALDVSGSWRLTVVQMISNAYFEKGEITEAYRHVNASQGLQKLYPHSPVTIYLRVTEIKCLWILGELETARKVLSNLSGENFLKNPDGLLTYVRLLSVLASIENHSELLAKTLLTSFLLSRSMQDELYEGLALAELKAAYKSDFPPSFQKTLDQKTENFLRIEKFLTRNTHEKLNYFSSNLFTSFENKTEPKIWNEAFPGWIFFKPIHLFLDLKTLKIFEIEKNSNPEKLIISLTKNPNPDLISFFKDIWGISFQKERHKTTLSMALKRMRDQTQYSAHVKEGRLTHPKILLIGGFSIV